MEGGFKLKVLVTSLLWVLSVINSLTGSVTVWSPNTSLKHTHTRAHTQNQRNVLCLKNIFISVYFCFLYWLWLKRKIVNIWQLMRKKSKMLNDFNFLCCHLLICWILIWRIKWKVNHQRKLLLFKCNIKDKVTSSWWKWHHVGTQEGRWRMEASTSPHTNRSQLGITCEIIPIVPCKKKRVTEYNKQGSCRFQ